MAAITKPGEKWIALCYSGGRFDVVTEAEGVDGLNRPFPHPAQLWRLERMEEKVVEQVSVDGQTHRPRVVHYLYIVVRTDHSLDLCNEVVIENEGIKPILFGHTRSKYIHQISSYAS